MKMRWVIGLGLALLAAPAFAQRQDRAEHESEIASIAADVDMDRYGNIDPRPISFL
jgi:hypothetical protein